MLDPELLRTLMTISDCGTFVGAASKLNQTPSAISMQIKRLEAELGTPVFEKVGKRVRLSKAGEMLIPFARRVVALLQNAVDHVGHHPKHLHIRLGISSDYVDWLLKDIVRLFADARPDRGVTVKTGSSGDLYEKLKSDDLDIAVITARQAWPDVDVLAQESLVWACAPQSDAPRGKPLPIALFREGCIRRVAILDALVDSGIPFRIAYSSEDLAGLIAISRTGLAIVPMVRSCIPPDLEILGPEYNLPALPSVQIGMIYGGDAVHDHALMRCIVARLME